MSTTSERRMVSRKGVYTKRRGGGGRHTRTERIWTRSHEPRGGLQHARCATWSASEVSSFIDFLTCRPAPSHLGLCGRQKRLDYIPSDAHFRRSPVFLVCSYVCFCLYGSFNSVSFHEFSRQLSILLLFFRSYLSALLVFSTTHLFMKAPISPDIIPSG